MNTSRQADESEFLTRIQVFKLVIDKAKDLCQDGNHPTGIPKSMLLGHIRLFLHLLDVDECYAHYAINIALKIGCLERDHGFLRWTDHPQHLIALRLMTDGYDTRHLSMRQLSIKFDLAIVH
jgi:hypothetical protein